MTGEEPAGPPTAGHPSSDEHLDEEGLRAWVAQLDRKLGTRTYAGAAAAILALAASIVALVIAVDARDNSAGSDDISRIESRLADLSEQADALDSAQKDIDSLDERLSAVEGKLGDLSAADSSTDKRISVIEDDIDDLRGQISDLGGTGQADGSGGISPGGASPGAGDAQGGGGGSGGGASPNG